MRQPIVLDTEFVTGVPDQLAEHTLYVSMEYATVAHKCCCGCGLEVVTPLSPTDWKLSYDGVSVSLHPSIGNWSFPCRSHYWIDKGKVRWAGDMSQEQINSVRAKDCRAKARYFDPTERPIVPASTAKPDNPKPGLWSWLARLWS
ncbi:DUF6527 family protein [Frigidibacter sp. RF13]|uniref:DUF6527 family protein n=1 Tax=Frigidibacter sp. RF13 TaxID=2997340 RepID=UPI002270A4E3|nr:DUF6527 family protein [Frigidibacter sp. RF13]MCY1128463.1 DUF6527 family protein [Frigidibacter sp. RF13]